MNKSTHQIIYIKLLTYDFWVNTCFIKYILNVPILHIFFKINRKLQNNT